MKKTKSNKENLQELLISSFKDVMNSERIYSNIATVKSVDETEKTCTVEIIDGAELSGVRLQQVASDDGLFLKPKANSLVIIGWTDKTTAFVSLFSEVDEVIFQGGNNGGLTITPELQTQLDKLSKRVDDIIDAIKNGVTAAQDGGAALLASQTVLLNLIIDKEDFSNIENDKFKH